MPMLSWPPRRWLAALAGAALFTLAAGIPTDVVPTPLFTRMTPVQWWNYPILIATAVLGGLLIATYVRAPAAAAGMGKTAGGGLLSALAIGCPVCNKLVVFALGFSGALTIWAPLQPALGIVSIALLGWTLRTRLATERACPVPAL
ncbi:hypothetical protein [Micromonospora aurantiaca (nom. illeg.)]|uniref:hypothetical protein n=1 Tax=Micromonospora aurantiaca (nom. illeg.) TaxID=47850 RepID=UPI001CA4246B|nr:hypothetical protein [Micromonospora aurantiaca]